MEPSGKLLQIATTCETEEQARELARGLVEARLAACVQIAGPIRSIYTWQGKIEETTEWRVLIKTSERRLTEVSEFLQRKHPYEVPQIVAVAAQASEAYARWVEDSVL